MGERGKVVDLESFKKKKKERDHTDHPRNKYGICEMCGKTRQRQNGACKECTEMYDL